MSLIYLLFFSNIFIFSCLISGGYSEVIFNFDNQCEYSIWLAASPGIGDNDPECGPQTFEVFTMPDKWSGSIWARTGCSNDDNFKFSCETGDCGSGEIDCQGPQPKNPVTLLNFNIENSEVSYELSLIHGSNIRVNIQPDGGSLVGESGPCPGTDCSADISNVCPAHLVAHNKNGAYVACFSPCDAQNQCGPNEITQSFKSSCPQAHTFIGDNNPPVHKCSGAKSYTITFCPPQ